MAEAFHDRETRAWNQFGRARRILRHAGKVILAGEQIERAAAGVDAPRGTPDRSDG